MGLQTVLNGFVKFLVGGGSFGRVEVAAPSDMAISRREIESVSDFFKVLERKVLLGGCGQRFETEDTTPSICSEKSPISMLLMIGNQLLTFMVVEVVLLLNGPGR